MGKVFLELSGAKIILKIILIHEATLPISLLTTDIVFLSIKS